MTMFGDGIPWSVASHRHYLGSFHCQPHTLWDPFTLPTTHFTESFHCQPHTIWDPFTLPTTHFTESFHCQLHILWDPFALQMYSVASWIFTTIMNIKGLQYSLHMFTYVRTHCMCKNCR